MDSKRKSQQVILWLTLLIRFGQIQTRSMGIFVGLKKSFETMDYIILLTKLDYYGVSFFEIIYF